MASYRAMRYAVAMLVVVLLAVVIATVATSRTREPPPTMRATYVASPVSEPWWMWAGRPLPPPPVPPVE